MPQQNDVVITGIGLLSSLGEGAEANWNALKDFKAPVIDTERFAPYSVHPLPEVDWSQQIAKRGDQRQMETWQRTGTYTAGLALEDAGIKDDAELCATMDMIVAAGGGERDVSVDTMILERSDKGTDDRGVMVNEVLTTELRPTLFLAQLSNLLAGNISIVHKVTGSSRTFMGEEGAGMSALQVAVARIRAGQSTHLLVGGAYNAEHPDMLLAYELGHHLLRDEWAPIWERDTLQGGGVVTGSGGAFLVLESREHAEKRGAKIYASLGNVVADQGPVSAKATRQRLDMLKEEANLGNAEMIVSGASGTVSRMQDERTFFSESFPGVPVRAVSSAFGHLRDTQFLLAVAVAAMAMSKGEALPALGGDFEAPADGAPSAIGVVGVGHAMSEGMVLVTGANA